MDIDVSIQNYRSFSGKNPLRFTLSDGFTCFVGPNNAGKSSILRFIYELRPLWQRLADDQLLNVIKQSPLVLQPYGVDDPIEIFPNDGSAPMRIAFTFNSEEGSAGSSKRTFSFELARVDPHLRVENVELFGGKYGSGSLLKFESEVLMNGDSRGPDCRELFALLRTLAGAMYIGPFRHINPGQSDTDYYDMKIGSAFIAAWDAWKAGRDKGPKNLVRDVATTIKTLFGFESLDINSSARNDSLQITLNDRDYALKELGAGLAQFIVVVGNVAMRRPSLLLIDEPELNLHASLQLDFLTALGKFSGAVLFASHSVGLARSIADRIYVVRQRKGYSEIHSYTGQPRLGELLGELHFSSYRELGFSKVLLVEGPTEVRTVQEFLRKLGKEHEVLLINLGGGGMICGDRDLELAELKRMSADTYALIDSERQAAGAPLATDRQAFVDCCKRVGIQTHVLDRRATENYFPERAVRAAVNRRALGPFESISDLKPGWRKRENWRIAHHVAWDEISNTDLGIFLATLCHGKANGIEKS